MKQKFRVHSHFREQIYSTLLRIATKYEAVLGFGLHQSPDFVVQGKDRRTDRPYSAAAGGRARPMHS